MKKRIFACTLLTCGATLFFGRSAFAYIDPGSGSYFFQIMAALFFSSLFAVKMFWGKVKGFFSGHKSKDKNGQ